MEFSLPKNRVVGIPFKFWHFLICHSQRLSLSKIQLIELSESEDWARFVFSSAAPCYHCLSDNITLQTSLHCSPSVALVWTSKFNHLASLQPSAYTVSKRQVTQDIYILQLEMNGSWTLKAMLHKIFDQNMVFKLHWAEFWSIPTIRIERGDFLRTEFLEQRQDVTMTDGSRIAVA